jgi:hypothetical protein
MRISIEVSPDEELCVASERHVLGGRRKTILLAGAAPVVAAVGLLSFGRSALAPALLLIGLGVIDLTVLPLLLPRLRARAWTRNPVHPRLVEVTPVGVRTVYAGFELTRPWHLVDDVVELPGQYLLMLDRRSYIALPTGRLTPAEADDLRTLLYRRDALVAA